MAERCIGENKMVNNPVNQTIDRLELDRRYPAALTLAFSEVGIADIAQVGGKNASLGELIQQLTPKGVKIPDGFATTAAAYRYFIQAAGIEAQLREIFADLDVEHIDNLRQCGKQVRSLMLQRPS